MQNNNKNIKILTSSGFLPRFSNSIRFSIPKSIRFQHKRHKIHKKKPKILKRNLADKLSFYKTRSRTAKSSKTEEHRLATKAFCQCSTRGVPTITLWTTVAGELLTNRTVGFDFRLWQLVHKLLLIYMKI